jgi:hypothetical protein
MTDESPEQVAKRAQVALETQAAIDYGSGFTDKEYPEIAWSMCGLPETNEIVIIAAVGAIQLGMAHLSGLAWPAMIDRIFGIDIDDQRLALWLSEQLWNAHSNQLIAEALRLRPSSHH